MNLRRLNIVAVAMLLLVFIPLGHYNPKATWWLLGFIAVVQISILVFACMNINSGYFMAILCDKDTKEKVVALTFDDGPHPYYTNQVLDTLATYDVKAAFFCIGKNIQNNESILVRMNNEAHVIANHSYSHAFWFDMFSSSKMLADMKLADSTITKATGLRPVLFRPPYGVMNPNLAKAIRKGRYMPVGWSIRSLDTAIKDKEKLLSRITGKLKPGSIILLHDSMEITVSILPQLIEAIQNKGYRITRADELLQIKPYA